jgi:hypothetical protein
MRIFVEFRLLASGFGKARQGQAAISNTSFERIVIQRLHGVAVKEPFF